MAFKLGSPIVSGGVFQANTNQPAIKRGTDVIAERGREGRSKRVVTIPVETANHPAFALHESSVEGAISEMPVVRFWRLKESFAFGCALISPRPRFRLAGSGHAHVRLS